MIGGSGGAAKLIGAALRYVTGYGGVVPYSEGTAAGFALLIATG